MSKHGITLPLERIIGFAIVDPAKFKEIVADIRQAVETGSDYSLPDDELNEEYVSGKINDIINYQFGSEKRALIELIANSLDAGASNIDVKDITGCMSIGDNGSGMDFDNLLYDLALPFFSSKDGERTVGRFGLGFFSTLFGLKRGGTVTVDTNRHGKAYKVVYSKENGNVNVTYSLGERKSRGTDVTIQSGNGRTSFLNRFCQRFSKDRRKRKSYTKDYVKYVNPDQCRILYNKRQLNSGNLKFNRRAKVYEIPFNGSVIRVGIGPSGCDWSGDCESLSGGIKIKSSHSAGFSMIIDYPLCIEPVEGRNDFIENDMYSEARSLVFSRAILPYFMSEGKRFSKTRLAYVKTSLTQPPLTSMLRPFAENASREELSDLLTFFGGRKVPVDKQIIVSTGLANFDFFYSDSVVLNGQYNDSYGNLYSFLGSNPNVLPFETVLRSSEKVKLRDMSPEEREAYGFYDLLLEHAGGWYESLGDLDVYLIDGPVDSKSPYASNRDLVQRTTDLYVNVNHRLFRPGVPEQTRRMALDYMLKTSLLHSDSAESRIIWGCLQDDV